MIIYALKKQGTYMTTELQKGYLPS